MSVCYAIRDWNEHFECSQSRKVRKDLSWIATPCKHDGKSFRRLMMMPNGVMIYGAWILIVQVAAKCPTRGVLADSDGPLTTEDLAIKTGAPEEVFRYALTILSDRKIGWISMSNWELSGSVLPIPTNKQTGQTEPTNQPPYPPTQASPAPNADPQAGGLVGKSFDDSWEAVAQRLASLGVVQWSQAVADAKAAGSDPNRCHALLDYAIRFGKGPGAISNRFRIASPKLGINSGWPNTDHPETASEKRAKREADQRAQRAAEEAEQQAWRMVKAGRSAQRPDDEIKAEILAAGLPWPNPAKVEKEKASVK